MFPRQELLQIANDICLSIADFDSFIDMLRQVHVSIYHQTLYLYSLSFMIQHWAAVADTGSAKYSTSTIAALLPRFRTGHTTWKWGVIPLYKRDLHGFFAVGTEAADT